MLPLLAVIMCGWGQPIPKLSRFTAVLLIILPAAVVLQLIPLPPSVWTALPGRDAFAGIYPAYGAQTPWLPATLYTGTTIRAGVSLIGPITLFLAVTALDESKRQLAVLLVLMIAVASFLLDIGQLVDGPESALRFYATTSDTAGVGFFANPNHNAAFLFCCPPLAAALYRSTQIRFSGFVFAGFIAVIALAILTTRSRTGLAFGLLSICVAVWIAFGRQIRTTKPRYVLIAGGLAFLLVIPLVLAFGLNNVVARISNGTLSTDERWDIVRGAWRAAVALFPIGSGIGTFPLIYPYFESLEQVTTTFFNRAHNDWLEVIIETGAAGLFVLLLWIGWLVSQLFASLKNMRSDQYFGFAGLIGASLLTLHSLWDYPLRTQALASLLALCAALTLPATRLQYVERTPASRSSRRIDSRRPQPLRT